MWDAILDAVVESLLTLAVIFVIYVLISFIEDRLSNLLEKKSIFSPLIGASIGIIPQCGLSVVAADMYNKKHITVGTLMAVFLACSDEALPILIASPSLNVLWMIIAKLVIGFIVGYSVDLILSKRKKEVLNHVEHCEHLDVDVHKGCCHHVIEKDESNSPWHAHLLHPLIHSLKIFAYVLVIKLIFNIIIELVGGEEVLSNFLSNSKYLAPLFSVLVGLIPNCASSVIITQLLIGSQISFGSALGGLCVNAGLGMVMLFKNKEKFKSNIYIVCFLSGISLLIGYITCIIFGF